MLKCIDYSLEVVRTICENVRDAIEGYKSDQLQANSKLNVRIQSGIGLGGGASLI